MTATLPGRTHGLGLVTEPLLQNLHFDRVVFANINLTATVLGAGMGAIAGWAIDRRHLPQTLVSHPQDATLNLEIGDDGAFLMNDWSFTQLCGLARVNKDTINRLSPDTASLAFRETLPAGKKPLQLLTSP